MQKSERQKLLALEDELHHRVIGQDKAIEVVSDAVRRSRAGLQDSRRPIGSFLFLGTTGVGKTELAKALAEVLFDDENQMTRIDMSEYQERYSVSRLIGASPGYIGYEEGGQLTEAVRRKPYSVILFDEIEKAHPDVFNILLQVLDDGRLTDNKGRTADFKNTIIIMTSNLTEEQVKTHFRPEFVNRIDEIVKFTPLGKKEIAQIVELQFNGIKRMLAQNGINVNISRDAIEFIAEVGFDPVYGARPVKRALQNHVLNALSRKILADEVDKARPINIHADNDKLIFDNNVSQRHLK
jgi:ATP-dependent Clp protease ATP-binding subunit ClpB